MTGKSIDIGNYDGFPALCRRPANPSAYRNPNARGSALERAEHQFFAFQEIEANPIHIGQHVIEQSGGVGCARNRIVLAF
jgi:hypothetical protein